MQFYISMFTILASLAAVTHVMPAPVHDNAGGMSHASHNKRSCKAAYNEAAAAEYKHSETSTDDEDALGDDSAGVVPACAF
ncbi:hypothetical protein GGS23DRAFT_565001 [Durotheca rogersii]|uniref:uncharacterized protein n=1 Tax=Durotheca rogersii TaxID=419775 RepID=UPI0022208445|nr:uncharacterized protein GGS23DRAFT_565001 [Durotheca rogersii]KAI5863696.1 hypothetical protein GGS23DRAFT_565001 [Durotheca rogersii]